MNWALYLPLWLPDFPGSSVLHRVMVSSGLKWKLGASKHFCTSSIFRLAHSNLFSAIYGQRRPFWHLRISSIQRHAIHVHFILATALWWWLWREVAQRCYRGYPVPPEDSQARSTKFTIPVCCLSGIKSARYIRESGILSITWRPFSKTHQLLVFF